MGQRKHEVQIEEFNPEIDSLFISLPDGREMEFIADFKFLLDMGSQYENVENLIELPYEDIVAIIHKGLLRKQPELALEEVESWLASPTSAIRLFQSVTAYIQEVSESDGVQQAAAQGEAQAAPKSARKKAGSGSGRTRGTTSASRTKNSGGSSRKR